MLAFLALSTEFTGREDCLSPEVANKETDAIHTAAVKYLTALDLKLVTGAVSLKVPSLVGR